MMPDEPFLDDYIDWMLEQHEAELDGVNSDPDVDPDEDDDTIGHPCDEMSHWDLGEPTLEDGGEDDEEREMSGGGDWQPKVVGWVPVEILPLPGLVVEWVEEEEWPF